MAETGSTNADLLAMADQGEPDGSVLVTDHQRSGRGRQQRVWHDEPGNSLLVSALLRPDIDLAPLIPLATGLAVVDAVSATLGVDDRAGPGTAGLKWPNDVLVPAFGERKLAGILAEAVSDGAPPGSAGTGGRLVVVVGTGMNLRWQTRPPPEIEARVVTLTELAGRPVDRDEVLGRYLESLDHWIGALEAGEPVIEAYRRACLTLGREVRFDAAGRRYTGRAVDVSDQGMLVLDTGGGVTVELGAGDAHHL